ncbi:catechol 2,3-dioxygenase-like lactoylglutathione lyase family enzyme [Gracilibacillus alcaliphilus]|nr:catechol 2,3-dioxygenase-like lactoylglutathione lyase family enzyme [Gracilibacillus alcaliphilus]
MNTIPILRMYDVDKTKEFYLNFLDFSLNWEHRFEEAFPLYMQISLHDCRLHLSEHHGDCTSGSAVRIEIDDLTGYHQLLQEKHYTYANPGIEYPPWGGKELTVHDPAGNRLIFYEN